MSVVKKAVGGLGDILGKASPLVGMLPGGNWINMATNAMGRLNDGSQTIGGSGIFSNLPMPQIGNPSGGGGFFGGLGSALGSIFGNTNRLGQMAGYGGLGLLGGMLANKLGVLDPRVVKDPRNQATDWFSNQIRGGQDVGSLLAGMGTLPGFQGPWTAGTDPNQAQAIEGMGGIFNQFMNGGMQQGQDILGMLGQRAGAGFALPPELQAAMSGATTGNSFLQNLAGGFNPGGQDMIGQAGNWLGQQMNNGTIQNLLQGGQTADIGQIGAALDAARRPGLNRDIRDLREQFSFNGLRRGTDIQNAVAARQAESESGMMGQLAGMLPQLTGQSNQTSLGTLNAVANLAGTQGQLGQMLGNLGLGAGNLQLGAAQGLNQSGLGVADLMGNLFNNQQGNSLQALLGMPGAFQGLSQLPGQMANQLFGMGTVLQNQAQQGIQNQIGGFNQQQSMIPGLLAFLGGTPQQQVTPSLLSQLGQLGLGYGAIRQGK